MENLLLLKALGEREKERSIVRRSRLAHSAAFKAKVAGDKTLWRDLAQQFEVHPAQIAEWKGRPPFTSWGS